MKYESLVEQVKALIEKAGKVDSGHRDAADQALKYSQAALNAAHAISVIEKTSEKRD